MIIHLLDIAPWPNNYEELRIRQLMQEEKDAKEQSKAMKKAEKKAAKQAKRTEKKLKKEAKKAEKKMKKAEKKLKKQFKDLSAAPTKTITTVQEATANNSEMQYASMPTGLILAVCASLLISLASAWYYRRHTTKA